MTTEIYSKDDLVAAKTRNKKTWTFFFTTTAVFLVGLAAGLLAFFRQTPDAPMRIPLLVADCVLAAIYAAFTVLYFIVNVGAAKKYAAFLEGVLNADPEKSTVNFMRIGEETELLDGVELRPFFALEWSDELEDYKDVKFYLDELKPLPPFKCGDIIEVAAYNGIMTGYAITAPAPAEEGENEADSFSAEENIQSV